jgi:hypothetical protein
MKRIAALTLLTLALASARTADACREIPVPIAEPTFTGSSLHAAIVKPVRITKLSQHGRRYWRAAYEIVKHRSGVPVNPASNVVVLEWACDPESDAPDFCGAGTGDALPGFADGRPASDWVQIELEHVRVSTLDGTPVFVARA